MKHIKYFNDINENKSNGVTVYHGHNNKEHEGLNFEHFPYFYMTPSKQYAK